MWSDGRSVGRFNVLFGYGACFAGVRRLRAYGFLWIQSLVRYGTDLADNTLCAVVHLSEQVIYVAQIMGTKLDPWLVLGNIRHGGLRMLLLMCFMKIRRPSLTLWYSTSRHDSKPDAFTDKAPCNKRSNQRPTRLRISCRVHVALGTS